MNTVGAIDRVRLDSSEDKRGTGERGGSEIGEEG